MTREIRKDTDFWGNQKEVIYEGGEKVGEIRNETTFFGTPLRVEYDAENQKVSETRTESTWLGEKVERTYDTDGDRVSETRHEKTFLGNPVDRTYSTDGSLVSETRHDTTLFGARVKRVSPAGRSTESTAHLGDHSASGYADYSPSSRSASSRSTRTPTGLRRFPVLMGWLAGFAVLEVCGPLMAAVLQPFAPNLPWSIGLPLFLALWAAAVGTGIAVTRSLRQ